MLTPNEYIRKLQKEARMVRKRDLGEEAEDEILKSTGKSDFTDEKFMECVYKKELGSDFETMDDGVAVGFYNSLPDVSSSEDKPRWFPERELIDFTQDSEYRRLYESQSD